MATAGQQVVFSNVVFQMAGTYLLQVNCTGISSPSAPSANFNIVAGPASKIAFTTQPPSAVNAGGAFNISLFVTDAFSNPIQSGSVTASIATGSGGTLNGTTTANISNGMVGFTGLNLTSALSGAFTLNFAMGPVVLQSSNINVTS